MIKRRKAMQEREIKREMQYKKSKKTRRNAI